MPASITTVAPGAASGPVSMPLSVVGSWRCRRRIARAARTRGQHDKRAVAAALLAVAAVGLGSPQRRRPRRCWSGRTGCDGLAQAEHRAGLAEQVLLQASRCLYSASEAGLGR